MSTTSSQGSRTSTTSSTAAATTSSVSLYDYKPTGAGAGVFAALFGLALLVLIGQLIFYCRQRTQMERQYVEAGSIASKGEDTSPDDIPQPCTNTRLVTKFIPLLCGIAVECGGYIARLVSRQDLSDTGPYIAQTVMLLIAPALMAASIYMNFGRLLILLRATSVSYVPARFSTTIFVAGDVFSLFLQAAGGGILASSDNHRLGSNIVIVGLVVQVLVFGFFIVTEVRFLIQAEKVSTVTHKISKHWKILNINLFICSILIMIRSIVRLVEYIQGFNGYIIEHEWFLYVFDAVPMFLTALCFILFFSRGNLFKVEFECTSMSRYSPLYGMREV